MSALFGIDTRLLYALLIGLVALERLGELVITRRNRDWALARGGVEVGGGHYPWMVLVHTLFLVACPAETWLLDRPFVGPLAAAMLSLVAASMALRYWVVKTLGRRWTTTVVCIPGLPVVTDGPFRYLRHPNYLAVVVEIASLPLVHGAWLTALVFSVANAAVLRVRIRVEEEALGRHGDYERLLPARRRILRPDG